MSEPLPRYRYTTAWPSADDDDAVAIARFWRDQAAITDEAAITRRLAEIVVFARDAEGAIAGVSTAYPATFAATGQPMYHYRCFVGREQRSSSLVRQLTVKALRALETYAQSHDFPCIGVVAELENPRFRSVLLDRPVWHGQGVSLSYWGRSPRGLDIRLCYFEGARLHRVRSAEVRSMIVE